MTERNVKLDQFNSLPLVLVFKMNIILVHGTCFPEFHWYHIESSHGKYRRLHFEKK